MLANVLDSQFAAFFLVAALPITDEIGGALVLLFGLLVWKFPGKAPAPVGNAPPKIETS